MRRPFCGAKLPSQARRSAGSTPRCLDLSQATNELETRQLLARCSGGTGVLLGRLGLPSAPVPTACAGGPQFCALTARIFVLACCAMEYVNLGSTGVKVSRICLGCMTYGSRKWREWVLEEPRSEEHT